MHAPMLIQTHRNVTTVAVTSDFMPTIMELLDVKSDNPSWPIDGISLLPFIGEDTALPRPQPLGFSWGGLHAVIDNEWKLMSKPVAGQCTFQEPYATIAARDGLSDFYLFNVVEDYHELRDQKAREPQRYARMRAHLDAFLVSINNSQTKETHCVEQGLSDVVDYGGS
eukprot:SAG31_NODE_3642_length_4032_cov_1.536232_3_plen_168_part_00